MTGHDSMARHVVAAHELAMSGHSRPQFRYTKISAT